MNVCRPWILGLLLVATATVGTGGEIKLAPLRKLSGGSFTITERSAPALGDFNGDGLLDLALGGSGQGGIFFNRGTPAQPRFTSLDLALPLTDGALQAVDFNHDGKLDLLNRANLFLNLGTPTEPRFATKLAPDTEGVIVVQTGPLPEELSQDPSCALVDLNDDGKLDLVITAHKQKPIYTSYSARWLVAFDEGHGHEGKFGTPAPLSIHTLQAGTLVEYTDHFTSPTFADLDGDGKLDAIYSGYGTGTRLLERTGPQNFVRPPLPLFPRFINATVGDLNGDGAPDLVLGNLDGDVILALNSGTPKQPKFVSIQPLLGGEFRVGTFINFSVADITSDGKPDIIVGAEASHYHYGVVSLFTQPPTAAPGAATSDGPSFVAAGAWMAEGKGLLAGISFTMPAPHVTDLDGDGHPDLLLSAKLPDTTAPRILTLFSRGGSPPRLFLDEPLSSQSTALRDVAGNLITPSPGFAILLADLDGDGLPDLLLGGNPVRWHRNLGRSTHPLYAPAATLPFTGHVAAGDLDGDGRSELVFSNGNALTWSTPTGSDWSAPAPLLADGQPITLPMGPGGSGNRILIPHLADLDSDSHPDLILGYSDRHEFHWARNLK